MPTRSSTHRTHGVWVSAPFLVFACNGCPRLRVARAAEILLQGKDFANARKAAEIALALPNATAADKAKAQAVLDQVKLAADPEGATSP